MHADEQTDAAVGGGAREDRQHREQQQGSEAVTLALAAARIGDRFQGGEQAGERHHGGLRCEGLALNRPGGWLVPQPQTPPSQTASVQNRSALGDAWSGVCWTGDATQLHRDMPEMHYVIGQEGGEIW